MFMNILFYGINVCAPNVCSENERVKHLCLIYIYVSLKKISFRIPDGEKIVDTLTTRLPKIIKVYNKLHGK